ncbi:MAG: ABC transporter substrate-binding protein [Dermatophilaceae bacterium]|nr:ABC transporter substrate-binding protein [Dermatophilaceae bacterium]
MAGLILALTATMPAACGDPASPATSPAPVVRFNQRLNDLLPQAVRDRGVLRVGTEASYAPMSSFGPDGHTIVGVEPDLGAQIGRVLGVRVQFRNFDFSGLLTDVAGGSLDLAISAMTDTPERARTADFINYFHAGSSIVVQRGNPSGVTELDDLCGKVVAVQSGTTQVGLLARSQKNCGRRPIVVKAFPTNSDALLQLRTGRAVAVLNDLPPAVFLVNDPRTRSQYQLASTVQYEPGSYGVVVAKSQPGLREAVQGALEELRRSGVYAQILSTWHVQDGAVQQITINSSR